MSTYTILHSNKTKKFNSIIDALHALLMIGITRHEGTHALVQSLDKGSASCFSNATFEEVCVIYTR